MSGCAAKYARAFSPETVNRAKALQYGLGGARFLVFFHRYAMGGSSGAYDGNGWTVMRSACGANKCAVA